MNQVFGKQSVDPVKDKVCLGNSTGNSRVDSQLFYAVVEAGKGYSQLSASGVWGVGPLITSDKTNSFIYSLYEAGTIASPQFTVQYTSLASYLDEEGQNNNRLTLGVIPDDMTSATKYTAISV